jgi:hypothetical protein
MVEAGTTYGTVVVLVSVIMVMKGDHNGREHDHTYAEKRQTFQHDFK